MHVRTEMKRKRKREGTTCPPACLFFLTFPSSCAGSSLSGSGSLSATAVRFFSFPSVIRSEEQEKYRELVVKINRQREKDVGLSRSWGGRGKERGGRGCYSGFRPSSFEKCSMPSVTEKITYLNADVH